MVKLSYCIAVRITRGLCCETPDITVLMNNILASNHKAIANRKCTYPIRLRINLSPVTANVSRLPTVQLHESVEGRYSVIRNMLALKLKESCDLEEKYAHRQASRVSSFM